MGDVLQGYHYARATGEKNDEAAAEQLLEEVCDTLSTALSFRFDTGLTGIGWGIEHLVQNGFVDADTDEILGEIDEAVWSARQQRKELRLLQGSHFGYGLYFLARLNRKAYSLPSQRCPSNPAELLKRSALAFCADECAQTLLHRRYEQSDVPFIALSYLNSVLYMLLEMHRLGIRRDKIAACLTALPGYITVAMDHTDDPAEEITTRYLLPHLFSLLPYTRSCVHCEAILNRIARHSVPAEASQSALVLAEPDTLSGKLTWNSLLYRGYMPLPAMPDMQH